MTGIKLNTTFTDGARLPLATSRAQRVLDIANRVIWAQADADFVTLSGAEITAFLDRAANGNSFAVSTARYADLVADQIGGYTAAQFTGSDSGATDPDRSVYILSGTTLDADTPYTVAAVFRAEAGAADNAILSRFSAVTTRMILNTNAAATAVRLQHGNSTISATIVPGEWCYVIARFDGTNLHLNVNGVDATPVTAGGTTGSAQLVLGALTSVIPNNQGFDGDLADALIYSRSLTDAEVATVADYFASVYGL